jgi:hypothetical protein
MRIFTAAVIFGAGYLLGRPEGRAKLAELLHRPEVAQLRQQATSTASTAARTGRQQLASATQKIKDTATEKRAARAADGSSEGDDTAGSPRGLRLPRIPRRGSRPDTSTVATAAPADTVTGAAAHDTSPRPTQTDGDPAARSAASPATPETPK